jgi:glycogen phosphorylase
MTTPTIPDRLRRLPELAADLWWTWNPQARDVFRRLDYPLWRQTAHNPVLMLRLVSQEMLNLAAADARFLRTYDAALGALDDARGARDTWWQKRFPEMPWTDRVLLRRVRAPPVTSDLCWRPRRAGG